MRQADFHHHRISIVWLACAAVMPFVAGCGSASDVGKVIGRVTLAGKPLAEGMVLFQCKSAGIEIAVPLESDGTYQAKLSKTAGLLPGDYKVAVIPQLIGVDNPLVTPPSPQKPVASPIPAKYRDTATSGLAATVKRGDNPPFNFDLSGAP